MVGKVVGVSIAEFIESSFLPALGFVPMLVRFVLTSTR